MRASRASLMISYFGFVFLVCESIKFLWDKRYKNVDFVCVFLLLL